MVTEPSPGHLGTGDDATTPHQQVINTSLLRLSTMKPFRSDRRFLNHEVPMRSTGGVAKHLP